ncbi:toxin CptA [Candidatus Pantoea floridensis]|uniref:Toxin CptA n=1 Tax=Candidatus Pantoea floridensis TaxID=1938870 RepID=A0A286BVS4_9GAMM|nr:toxin CptA [Enterobacteriaceae bacterium JKS000233]SOD38228.1 toxin CptA [Pantoea floridensis]
MALFALCVALLLSLSWPDEWAWCIAPILVLLLVEGWRNERHLVQRVGCLALDVNGEWLWREARWRTERKADWLPFGVLLVLRNQQGKRWRLWLMHDNLPPGEWRTLRACCFLHEEQTLP